MRMWIKEQKKQLAIIICILIILITIGFIYMTYMIKRIEANTNNSIKTIVKNDANNLKTEITEQKAILQAITNQILTDNIVDEDKIFDMYERSDITSKFVRMAIMYENGNTITNDGYNLDYSDEKENFFANNKIHVFENRISKIDGQEINIYSQAIETKNEKIAILLIVSADSYKNTFSNKIFEGKGFSYIVDEHGNITGMVVEREEAHRRGILHRTSHVWIVREKNGQLQILLQKRSEEKDSHPGCYDISSAGHIPAGEDFISSALRELKEELGYDAKPEQLIYCGQRQFEFQQTFHGKLFHDNQVSNVYLMWLDQEPEQFTLQKEEISEVRWMELKECIQKVKSNQIPNCIYLEELEMIQKKLLSNGI